jgi:peptidoglycan/xylan/chitin deacetylase (PgdA/CDA1 family)
MKARGLILILSVLWTISSSFAADRLAAGPEATILCYHIVESPHDPRMEITRETFLQQMRYLATTGYTVIPLSDLYAYISGKKSSLPRNAVVITVDDGWRSTYTEFYPEMKRRNFPFTVFVYPRIIGQTAYALTWSQIRDMARDGADIESHSLSHPFLTYRRHTALDAKSYAAWLHNELLSSKRIIEQETGKSVQFFAYPYGDYDSRLERKVEKAGYAAAVTCEFGRVHRGSDPLRLRRLVIDKLMSFAVFRYYLGAKPLRLEETTPELVFNPDQPVVSAKIAEYKRVDPSSVGMALLSLGTTPFSYDPRNGSISLVVHHALKGSLQRAIVWATDTKTGKRLEAVWSFRLPGASGTAEPATERACPPSEGIEPSDLPVALPAPPQPAVVEEPAPGQRKSDVHRSAHAQR